MTNKYTLAELKLGMQVRKSQLSEILDTYVVLTNTSIIENDIIGKIEFIGEEITEEVAKLRSPKVAITTIYNNSTEIGDNITIDD